MRRDFQDFPDNDRVTVPLTGRDVDDLQRLLGLLLDASIQPMAEPHSVTTPTRAALMAHARLILTNRRRRIDHFGRGVFGEPAWEILLLLYITVGGQRQTVPRLSELSGISRSTAIRWIEYLEREKLVSRVPHPNDRRVDFIELTDKGREKLEAYLSETIDNSR